MGALLILLVVVIAAVVIGSIFLKLAFALLGWLIIGAIAGWLASRFMDSRGNTLLTNLVLGVAGSVISGFLLNVVRLGGLDNNIIGQLIFATLGAMVLIGIGRVVRPGSSRRNSNGINTYNNYNNRY